MADQAEPDFPTSPSRFPDDARISFSKADSRYIAVADDGSEFEFDAHKRKWFPAEFDLDELGDDDDGGSNASRKRKQSPTNGIERNDKGRSAKRNKAAAPAPRQNTAVYVTGLPPDATVDEVHELFARKAGVVAEDDTGAPRIKLYRDEQDNCKGDALVVFFKPQSVDMAIMLLDDADFRLAASGASTGRIKVQVADASYKKSQPTGGAEGAPGAAAQQPPPPQLSDKERQKLKNKRLKMAAKLTDWDDDDGNDGSGGGGVGNSVSGVNAKAASRWEKVVILKHMFTLAELEEDPASLLDIKEDVRDECAKLGTVTNVVLFDAEPDGVVSVKFADADAADACVRLMDGRSFDGRVVEAHISMGKEKFKKARKKHDSDNDSDVE